MTALDLIAARPWRSAVFTTYALSLAFFEALVLEALVRGGGRGALILADVDGVRAALSEQGARRAGRDYEVEPVGVERGVFHSKMTVLADAEDCHLLVGSGNLTFGGWGGNLEVLEHLHPSFAADAFEDAAGFFEALAAGGGSGGGGGLRHGASEACGQTAATLRTAAGRGVPNGNFRLFHSLGGGGISQALAQAAHDLGGATQLIVASPFWDGGAAIDALAKALELDEVLVHAHPGGTVQGTVGANWPARAATFIRPVRLAVMEAKNEKGETEKRRLHAKTFEILCRRGRILLSGSANATRAALGAGFNVEASVARIQRQRTLGWTHDPTDPLDLVEPPEEDEDAETEARLGVLRAVLDGDRLIGQVLTPRMSGAARAWRITSEGPAPLGEGEGKGRLELAADGRFSLATPGLELESWKGGRLIVRIEAEDGRRAEGFVSILAISELTRRAGSVAPRLLALLSGTETPADVLAIMAWMLENPGQLTGALPSGMGGAGTAGRRADDAAAMVAVADLAAPSAPGGGWGPSGGLSGAGWSRVMAQIFAALRNARGPFETEDENEDDGSEEEERGGKGAGAKGRGKRPVAGGPGKRRGTLDPPPPEPAIGKALANFSKMLDMLLSPDKAAAHAMYAFDMGHYVFERLTPDVELARSWLARIVDAAVGGPPPPERVADVAAAVLVLLEAQSRDLPTAPARARGRMLRLGLDMAAPAAPASAAGLYRGLFPARQDPAQLWAALQAVRTVGELARAYGVAWRGGPRAPEIAELEALAPQEWPTLWGALSSEHTHRQVLLTPRRASACPKCSTVLPTAEKYKLDQFNIARAANCCGRVIVCEED